MALRCMGVSFCVDRTSIVLLRACNPRRQRGTAP
jgi:hypothetical protein